MVNVVDNMISTISGVTSHKELLHTRTSGCIGIIIINDIVNNKISAT